MSASMPNERRLWGGRYQIEERIGRGGAGVVYRAMDRRLRRVVAVKCLPAHQAEDPAAVERLTREARAAATLSSPHIVAVLDWGVDDGEPYLVMEYLPGGNLAQHVARRLPLPPAEVVDYGQQIAAALAVAHERGLVHRDVNLRNVLVAADGRLKLTDFGIARSPGAVTLTERGVALGTAVAMAPEQATGRPVSPATDIYALGVLLYILAVGRPPFDGGHDLEVLRRHIETPPPPPSQLNPAVPAWLERVILRAMAKRPADRYPDGAAIGEALAAGETGLFDAPPTRPVLVSALRAASGSEARRAAVAAARAAGRTWRPAPAAWSALVLAALLLALVMAQAWAGPPPADEVAKAANDSARAAIVNPVLAPPLVARDPTATSTPTRVPATSTVVPPAATPAPPVVVAAPPTNTPVPSTATAVPATATPPPPAPVVVAAEEQAPMRHAAPVAARENKEKETEKQKDNEDDKEERRPENRGQSKGEHDDDGDDDPGRKPAETRSAPKPEGKPESKREG